MTRSHETGQWRWAGGFALFALGLGVALRQPSLALVGALSAGFAGYARLLGPALVGGDHGVTVERTLDTLAADPGDTVDVTVTVRNEGERPLPDVRVVDGVPEALPVVSGTPRHAAVLRAGEATTFEYAVAGERGEHSWRPAQVAVSDPSGATEFAGAVAAETTLTCAAPPPPAETAVPLGALTTPYAGRFGTDSAGEGVAFHGVREYRPGDPLHRVDWYRRARHGELGTVEFREERGVTVQLLVDTRKAAYLAPAPDAEHAVSRSVAAADAAFVALLAGGDRVGVASLARPSEDVWLDPATGEEHRRRGRELLAGHPAFDPRPPERGVYERFRDDRREELFRRRIVHLHRRLPPNAQVVLFSPVCDDYPATLARGLDARGRDVTVVSPDPTTGGPAHRRLARLVRRERLDRLGRAGVRVVDWPAGESFAAATERAGWSP